MPNWICPTCGGHYDDTQRPPQRCDLCADERQWLPASGQRWTTMEELRANGYATEVRVVEPGLHGIGVDPGVGVGQRGLLVSTPEGNLLWDPPPFLDEHAIAAVCDAGGLRAVSSSHPHMYGAIMDWSAEFDAEIVLPQADQQWLRRHDRPVTTWSGMHEPLPGVTLVQCGGHFPGSAALHWADTEDGAGALFTGDTIMVTPGEDRVTFMWSAPNRLPLPEFAVRRVVDALHPFAFGRIYAGWWEPAIRRDAKNVLIRSADRYVQFLRGEVSID
jgi:glyoxylase-like metal-dependent hydrolase (beta-lactamase superfamily II)